MNISIVGLGKLGLCTAACFAAKGHKVVGVDTNPATIAALRDFRSPIAETGLPDLLAKAWPCFQATHRHDEALHASDITLIIVPTPSLPDGRFTNEYIETALRALAPVLKTKPEFHVVGVVSTVMPGSCDKVFRPLLESLTGKICGQDFGLVYNPEFIALGSVIRNFLTPDLVLIGESDARSGSLVETLYRDTVENRPRIARMSLTSAEIAKLSLNCYVTMKISFANELASLCERMPGADVDAITEAIGADSRIGAKYLKAGLGFGGPCFPRDNLAFQAFAREVGAEAHLGPQVVAVNRAVVDRLFALATRDLAPGATVAIFGLAYKPQTHIVEDSQAVMLAERLADAGYRVRVHDPQALDAARHVLGTKVIYCRDAYAAATDANAIALLTPWPEYAALDWLRVAKATAHDAVVIDVWRTAPAETLIAAGLKQRSLGRF